MSRAYLVNGGNNAPDWLRKGAKSRNKKAKLISEDPETQGVRLIQDSDFPEASNRIKTTRDGKFIVATGTYKPRIKVLDLSELALKFERITDNETIDFELLSDDWTKSLHVQADRTVELHDQRASFYRTRIPTPGRCIAYHSQTCDALVGAQGGYVCRLNLEQGRFMTPFALAGSPTVAQDGGAGAVAAEGADDPVVGVNCIDINPAHQLLAFGTETANGRGTVELWDHRTKSRSGLLSLPYARIAGLSGSSAAHYLPGLASDGEEDGPAARMRSSNIAVTALASRFDGLKMAVGLSTGHTLLFDIRSPRPYALKDQGYGLPVKRLQWPSGHGQSDGAPLVASADEKVVKVWSASTDTPNLVSINPPTSLNDMHIVPSTGLMWLANEGSPLTAYYVPQLGPAPTWCRFLDNMTEEMEEGVSGSVYEDYKFVDRQELRSLNLDHLIGTTALRPYMHGFFVDLRLYTKARAIANPFQYAEYRDRQIAAKLDAERDSRIRTSKADENRRVKVNAALVERMRARDEAKSEASSGKKRKREKERQAEGVGAVDKLLTDDRFSKMFQDKAFEVDTTSREFALLNPSAASQQQQPDRPPAGDAESEEEQSDREEEDGRSDQESTDSSVEGDLTSVDARRASKATRPTRDLSRPAPADEPQPAFEEASGRPTMTVEREASALSSRNGTIGQRSRLQSTVERPAQAAVEAQGRLVGDGGRELSFIPDPAAADREKAERKAARQAAKAAKAAKESAVGSGLQRGPAKKQRDDVPQGEDASGRTRRRHVGRSASKTQMRNLSGR